MNADQSMDAAVPTHRPSPIAEAIRHAFVVALISTKGGVGKTTTCANLGGLLVKLGFRVLLIDGDNSQAALSKYYELVLNAPHGLTHVLRTGVVTDDAISKTIIDGLDIIVADDEEGALPTWLASRIDRGTRLRMALKSPAARRYDFILIDTQGATGPLQEAAALAADIMLSPISPDILSAREFLNGTISLMDRLEAGVSVGAAPGQMYALIYRQDRTRDSLDIARAIRSDFVTLRGKITVLNSVVPHGKVYKEAASRRIPVHEHDPEWRDTELDGSGRIVSGGSGFTVMHRLLWELIPSLEGHRADSLAQSAYEARVA